MASIGWHGVSIAVATVLIAGCAGFLLFARDLTEGHCPSVEKTPSVEISQPFPSREDIQRAYLILDLARSNPEFKLKEDLLTYAHHDGLTSVTIVEELYSTECGCEPPRTDRVFLLHAHECSAICACVDEDTGNPDRFSLFPAE